MAGETMTGSFSRSRAAAWLRSGRGGLFLLALGIGAGSGLGAVAFRYLINVFTWLATGNSQFGQQGRVPSGHLPWLGLGFFVLIPAIGGLIYGPLIYTWAREARGHGVPEVMIAVTDNGGRIRPQVSVVKAVASALCIGTGGSVGREGPIVQIGSALASSLGQWVRMPENRLRIMVACGAAGGISATFNAPVTGVFFGVEIILREFSVDALFTVMLSSMIADITAEPLLGSRPFLSGFPAGIMLHHPRNYLLVAVLAVLAALMGLAFKTVLYKTEDLCDKVWGSRPEWARPAVGGLLLGLLLLAIPQLYGVGYPVMYKTTAGGYALWFVLLLAFGKIAATSLSIGIGGSGGVFAPSLFIGVTSGMAFGDIVHHLLGPGAGQPVLYAVVAMGAVFTSAARAPLTSLASVVEMTGDFSLTLPVMLAVAIASTVSRTLSYGTIYTTKLLRRGTDIDRAAPWQALADLKVTDAMHPFRTPLPAGGDGASTGGDMAAEVAAVAGPVARQLHPQAIFAGESLGRALRQLEVYGRDGLPVLSGDGQQIQGWVTNTSVLQALARQLSTARAETARAQLAADWGHEELDSSLREPPFLLPGYRVAEITIAAGSQASGQRLGDVAWPAGSAPVTVLRAGRLRTADPGIVLRAGDRISLLAAAPRKPEAGREAAAPGPPGNTREETVPAQRETPVVATWAVRLLRVRWIVRAPVWLYRARLGFVFGSRLLMLEHTGRKTGIRRYVVLEAVDHPDPGTYVVAAGFGDRAQWLRNVRATPAVRVYTGARRPVAATARPLTSEEAAAALAAYARRHPRAWAALRPFFETTLGARISSDGTSPPMIALDLAGSRPGGTPEPGR